MSAIGMLVRTAWRRHWGASLFLALVAGLAAAVVGASFQAVARADTSLERFNETSRIWDQMVQGCPPGVNPDDLKSQSDAMRLCANPAVSERLRRVLDGLDGVERTSVGSGLVVGLFDSKASNHWGGLTLLQGVLTPGAQLGHPIVVEGRLVDPAAPDEIALSEGAARSTGLHAGDDVRMAGWHQADLDTAIDGTMRPQTPPFTAKVVGVVRSLEDVQPTGSGSLAEGIEGTVYAGPGWMAAHGSGLAGYGAGVLVRLRGGPSAASSFQDVLNKSPGGWLTNSAPVSDLPLAPLQRVIDLERRAVLVFAAIAILAGLVFVGLTTVRQLRKESAESPRLSALGMTRRDLRMTNVARAVTIAVPASVVAVVAMIAASPLGPVGLARKLEFDLGVRVDVGVLAVTAVALLVLFALAGLVAPIEVEATARSRAASRAGQLNPAIRSMGPVPVVGTTVARGRSSRAAIVVTVVAMAAVVAAGGLVASYDRMLHEPERFGAWWDVVVGQYSEQPALDGGIAKLRANPAVVAAAGYDEQTDIARVDGRNVPFLASTDYVGHHGPVMESGRVPVADDEVALGRATARKMHKGIGDVVTAVSNNDTRERLHVVGIVVVNDPINSQWEAGQGVFVRPTPLRKLAGPGGVPQSIVVKLDPKADRAAAFESVRRDFSGSIREALPPADVRNVGRLRTVPWLIAALVGILALATLIHALVTMLGRHRTTLAVSAALGFTPGQRRNVAVFASVALVFVGVVIGIPVGLVVGSRVWTAVANGIGLTSGSVLAWTTLVAAGVAALGVAALVAVVTSRGSVRMEPGEQLTVE